MVSRELWPGVSHRYGKQYSVSWYDSTTSYAKVDRKTMDPIDEESGDSVMACVAAVTKSLLDWKREKEAEIVAVLGTDRRPRSKPLPATKPEPVKIVQPETATTEALATEGTPF